MLNLRRYIVIFPKCTKCFDINSRCLASAANKAQSTDKKEPAKPKSHPPKETQSFMMNLFRGVVNTSQMFPYPDVLTEEQRETLGMLIDPVEKFFMEVNDAAENDANEQVSAESLAGLWDLGAFGLQVPQELGGLGLTNTQYARLVEIVGGYDLGVGITLGSHQSIGFKGILLVGTKEQKAKYLPRVSTGKEFAAFCLTEPSSGSDAGSIRTRAVLSPDGKHFIMNGSKIWISNGGIAEIMTVFAQTPVPDKTGKTVDRVTAFIVERAFGGISSGPPEKKMGIKASNTTEVFYEDVKIPIENVLGEVGGGFKVAMAILNNGRFGMGAALSGTMRKVMEQSVAHATQRIQFGHLISTYGAIQEKLARMAMLHYVTESMAYSVSGNMDNGSQDYHLEAAASKVFASDAAWAVTDEAIQILGGTGYMRSAGLERVVRDLRIFRIFEGTNDILKLFVALTGIQYAGLQLRQLQKALKNPKSNMGLVFSAAMSRVLYKLGLSRPPSLSHLVHPTLAPSMDQTVKSISLFGPTIESSLMKYGKGIVEEQFVLNRIGHAAIDIYSMMVILSRASTSLKKGLESAEHERIMVEVWCSEASERVAKNLGSVTDVKTLGNFKKMAEISKNVCESGGFTQKNPLGF